jgi:hypothetical protein
MDGISSHQTSKLQKEAEDILSKGYSFYYKDYKENTKRIF